MFVKHSLKQRKQATLSQGTVPNKKRTFIQTVVKQATLTQYSNKQKFLGLVLFNKHTNKQHSSKQSSNKQHSTKHSSKQNLTKHTLRASFRDIFKIYIFFLLSRTNNIWETEKQTIPKQQRRGVKKVVKKLPLRSCQSLVIGHKKCSHWPFSLHFLPLSFTLILLRCYSRKCFAQQLKGSPINLQFYMTNHTTVLHNFISDISGKWATVCLQPGCAFQGTSKGSSVSFFFL